MSTLKKLLAIDVLAAAQQRIEWTFDTFQRIYISFSGGKDSTVMTHLVLDEAKRRGRKVGLLFVDLEAQYNLTIEHAGEIFGLYRDNIEPYWCALPLILRNAVSQFEPRWICWDSSKQEAWVRRPDALSITDPAHFPFFRVGMEFEEFVQEFGAWYSGGSECACFVGIRSDESLNRFRTLIMDRPRHSGHRWTARKSGGAWNVYPIYDWRTEDIWRFHAKTGLPYNRLYDRMYLAGLSIHQMRICQPYGDDQRKGLWLYQIIEPETWGRVVARVNGANQGAMYAHTRGNMSGNIRVSKPAGHTWQSFARLLLATMPEALRDHYANRIDTFLYWWAARGVTTIADEEDPKLENKAGKGRRPSWRRIAKCLLRNDYWAKGLSFSQLSSTDPASYNRLMTTRRKRWKEQVPQGKPIFAGRVNL